MGLVEVKRVGNVVSALAFAIAIVFITGGFFGWWNDSWKVVATLGAAIGLLVACATRLTR